MNNEGAVSEEARQGGRHCGMWKEELISWSHPQRKIFRSGAFEIYKDGPDGFSTILPVFMELYIYVSAMFDVTGINNMFGNPGLDTGFEMMTSQLN